MPEIGWRKKALSTEFDDILTGVYDQMKLAVLVYMKHDLSIPDNELSDNIDYDFLSELLWRVTFGRNGKHSIRTIVEDRIMRGKFELQKLPDYAAKNQARQEVMRSLVPQIESEVSTLFEDRYHNIVSMFDVERKKVSRYTRCATQERIIALLREHVREQVSPVLETLFDINESLHAPGSNKV